MVTTHRTAMAAKSKKDAKRRKIGFRPPGRPGRKKTPSVCYLDAVPSKAKDITAADQPHRRDLPEAQRLDPLAESPLGILLLTGFISREQMEAGRQFALCVSKFRAVFRAPREGFGGGHGYNCPTGGCGELKDDCPCQTSRDRYMLAYDALSACGRPAVMAVNDVVVHGREISPDRFPALKLGLSGLEAHFGVRAAPSRSKIVAESYGPQS